MPEQSFLEAIRTGLHEEMSRDPSVYLFGEDVALGGPFGVTAGLAEAFGKNRVVNTPISEGTVMGLAIGAATARTPPGGGNHVHRLHYFGDGPARQPRRQAALHVRRAAEDSPDRSRPVRHQRQHGRTPFSESGVLARPCAGLESGNAASNPADAKGLLKAAIRDDNPVVFIEHRGLYWTRGQVPEGESISYRSAKLRSQGKAKI